MATLLAELKRRNIYRIGAAYAVVAWVLLQLAANVSPILELPPWIARLVLLLLIVIGFPVALVFAWVHQLAPESGPLSRVTTGKLDLFLASVLVVVIGLVLRRGLNLTRTYRVDRLMVYDIFRSMGFSARLGQVASLGEKTRGVT